MSKTSDSHTSSARRRISKPPLSTPLQSFLAGAGNRISLARRIRGWSQADLAERAGIGLSTMVFIEKGAGTVEFGSWLRVIESLGMEASLADFVSLKHDSQSLDALEEVIPKRAKTGRRK